MKRSKPGPIALPGSNPEDCPLRLERFLPYRLRVLSQSVSHRLAGIYTVQFNLSASEWRTMTILARYQPLSANEVGARSSMDKVQVSRAVARMTGSGLILRETDPHDRRRARLRLSA
jgi:DNA-binding MarR family transcriptional regulator